MTPWLRITGAVLLTGMLVGCSDKPQRVAYIEACMAELRPLERTGKELGDALTPWLQGEAGDLAVIEAKFALMKGAAENTNTNIASHRALHLVSAPDFDAAMDDYLDHLNKTVAETAAVVGAAKENNPGDVVAIIDAVEAQIAARAREQRVLQALLIREQEGS